MKQKPKMLLIGMPRADSSFYEMNIAQLPQGPRILFLEYIFKIIRLSSQTKRKIRMALKLENIFNPKRKSPYMGLRLIEQNLRNYLDIDIIEYPSGQKAVINHIKKNDTDIVGISIGCENRIYDAKKLAKAIKKARPEIKIVFGNYGAVAGKTLREIRPDHGIVLWDSMEEREAKKKAGKDFYKGEGVHDIRLWLHDELSIDCGAPNAPLISEAVKDSGEDSSSKIGNWLKGSFGFITAPKDSHKLVSAIGCTNNCDFCNSSKLFNREKTFLFRNAEAIFTPIQKIYDANMLRDDYPPEANFFIMDENFMKEENVASQTGALNFMEIVEKLCGFIEGSKKNIHFGTFSDIKSLLYLRNKYGNLRKLVQGGITSIWIGIESREDVFNKRGGASPEIVKEIVTELQGLGIIVIGSFIVGLPYHTEEETRKRDGKFECLNIWEDAVWWRSLNTGARQVMMHSITGIVGTHDTMFKFSDYEFGHRAIPDFNKSKISGKRLEKLDEKLRELFYIENGPVAISSLLVMWDGFMNLKDSDNYQEILAATFYYWMVKRNIQRVILASFFFDNLLLTKCSDKFLHRVAKMFSEIEKYSPKDTEINKKYEKVHNFFHSQNSKASIRFAEKRRLNFIEKYNK